MREQLQAYIDRVRALAEHCHGNEQATKQSLIGPLFTLLGYDLTDPRECRPEYRADFGKERSVKPVDWAFFRDTRPAFFVEAKEVNKKLPGYDEQLADYFAKVPEVKLGILSNGLQWRFFTDLVNLNVMDHEPFVRWDVMGEDPPPYDFLTLLQKSQYNNELIRTFAQRRRRTNLLVAELSRLLEPSPEFTRLAILNLETRTRTEAVIESWKPVLAAAIGEWAKQRALSNVLSDGESEAPGEPAAPQLTIQAAARANAVETTPDELDAFAIIEQVLGAERQVAYQDTASYFKVHLPEKPSWVVCRLYLGRRRNQLLVPLPAESVLPMVGSRSISAPETGWCAVQIASGADLAELSALLQAAWDLRRREHPVTLKGPAAGDKTP
jgi:hypothetical protein